MGNEFVTPSRAPKVRRRAETGHLTCKICLRFRKAWNAHVQPSPWKQAQVPVEKLGAEDPQFDAGPGEQTEEGHGPSGNEFISHDERMLQLAEAVRIGLLTPHEEKVLAAVFTIIHDGQRLSWRAVAKLAGGSADRARRELGRAFHRWHTVCGPNDRLVIESQTTVTHIRGTRQPDVWRRYTFRLGSREMSWSERVTDSTERRAALATRHSPWSDAPALPRLPHPDPRGVPDRRPHG